VQPRVEVEWNVLATEARYRPNRDLEESFAMSTATPAVRRLRLGPRSAGMLLKPAEFDRARFLEGWRYELINGVLVVSPTPSRKERDPNEELGHWLRSYRENHPQGESLDVTLPEETLETGENRRRADRVIWAVSSGKVNQDRDYIAKRAEYRGIGVREYWVVDRFRRTLTVFIFSGESDQERVIPENQSYKTPLLPGFELPLGRLLTLADRWAKKRT
jgi:Uma2 family endonuclease